MDDNIEFVTICPKRSNYIKQIELLNYSIKILGNNLPKILVPSYSKLDTKDVENEIIRCRLENKTEDIYFEKFVLKNIQQITSKQYFLYLDPDHIIFDSLSLKDFNPQNAITTSSEINNLREFLSEKEFDHIANIMCKNKNIGNFYNTSLLFSDVSYFTNFSTYWQDTYRELYDKIIKHRHLEEIAFSVSSKNNNFLVNSSNENLQGNFKNRNMNSKIFHYGGEYKETNIIKNNIIYNVEMSITEKYHQIKHQLCLLSNT